MEFKGVKGKWNYNHEQEAVYSESGYVIADIFPGGQEANGVLISKAPEMLEMLKTYLKDLDNIFPRNTFYMDRMKQIQQLIKEATEL